MKIKDLLNGIELDTKKEGYIMGGENYLYAQDRKVLKKYLDSGDVIAYDKSKLGNIFIFKGVKGTFGFFCLRKEFTNYFFNQTICRRINLKKALTLLGDDCIIENKKEFKKVKKLIMLKELKNDNSR